MGTPDETRDEAKAGQTGPVAGETSQDAVHGLPCIVCEYDLSGLDAGGLCPECGQPIELSVLWRRDAEKRSQPLSGATVRAYLWGLGLLLASMLGWSVGMWWLVWTGAGGPFAGTIGMMRGPAPAFAQHYWFVAVLAGLALGTAAWWIIITIERRGPRPYCGVLWRHGASGIVVLRISHGLACLAAMWQGSTYPWGIGASFAALLLSPFVIVASTDVLTARRTRQRGKSSEFVAGRSCGGCLFLAVGILALLALPHGIWAAGLLAVVALFWPAVALVLEFGRTRKAGSVGESTTPSPR